MGANPNLFWYPYLKKALEKSDYKVWVPNIPDSSTPDLAQQLEFFFKEFKLDNDTILIGHSSGSPLILSILERINTKIKRVILVSGFYKNTIGVHPILQEKYNWEKIKQNCDSFVIINSDNDPYDCDDKMGKEMSEKLGGKQIILHGEGHMGSLKFKQPYKKFPFLLKLIEG